MICDDFAYFHMDLASGGICKSIWKPSEGICGASARHFEGICVAEVGLGKIHGFACILGSRFIELHGFHGFWDPDSWILRYCEIQIQWFATNSQIIGSRL